MAYVKVSFAQNLAYKAYFYNVYTFMQSVMLYKCEGKHLKTTWAGQK